MEINLTVYSRRLLHAMVQYAFLYIVYGNSGHVRDGESRFGKTKQVVVSLFASLHFS